ncbi:MAG: aminotransferase class V-fold PLP-dependent enzyme [Vicinamibacterales bacterium]
MQVRVCTDARGAMDCADAFFGLDAQVPLAGGRLARYINLDNAATTPPLRAVVDAVHESLRYYASVHRGAGYKSRTSTAAFERARETLARFVGADPVRDVVVFGRNTTDALNKVSNRLPMPGDAVVVSTLLEHHSNDLPWRRRARVVRARITADGRLDEADFDRLLALHAGRIALVAVSAASNVTGVVQPIHRLARKAHAAGAPIVVDAAQLVAHRRLDMRPHGHPEHLDFVAFSGHKMYAPFGSGALVGPRSAFEQGPPDAVGGGTVDIVTESDVAWGALPDREEAGTPNAVGVVAMAAAAEVLTAWDLDSVDAHESALAAYARSRLSEVPGVTIYGEPPSRDRSDRVGVIPFNLAGWHHDEVAERLGREGGIGVRNGCFCAQPYVAALLGIPPASVGAFQGSHAGRPGMVRISLAAYNTGEEIDAVVALLARMSAARGRRAGAPIRRAARTSG